MKKKRLLYLTDVYQRKYENAMISYTKPIYWTFQSVLSRLAKFCSFSFIVKNAQSLRPPLSCCPHVCTLQSSNKSDPNLEGWFPWTQRSSTFKVLLLHVVTSNQFLLSLHTHRFKSCSCLSTLSFFLTWCNFLSRWKYYPFALQRLYSILR